MVLGDSLSDTGNAFIGTGGVTPPSPPYAPGRFSNGPIWIDYIAAAAGLPAQPFLVGGSNFAVGGARTGLDGAIPGTGVMSQAGLYLASAFDPLALHIVTGGGNDLLDAAESLTSPTDLSAAGQLAALNLLAIANQLATLGADRVMLSNVADVGITPESFAAGTNLQAQIASTAFNTTLYAGYLQLTRFFPTTNFYFVDQNAIATAIIQDANFNGGAAFGITNVTAPCILDTSICNASLFFDNIHPTSQVHALYAAAALEEIPEPSTIALAAAGFAALVAAKLRDRRQ